MVKQLIHPTTGVKVKLGRKRPIVHGPRFQLRNYLMKSFPAPPTEVDYTAKAMPVLSQVLCNDSLGCCTASGALHIGGTWIDNAGGSVTWSDQQVIAFYSATSGYVPGDESTDNGADEQTVLNYWQEKGLLGDGTHKATAWISVDATNQEECMAALWLFENIYFGVELPDAWISPFPSNPGFTWDVAGDPDPSNGHCFVGLKGDANGVGIDTWGLLGTCTWAAVAKYASNANNGELYTILGPDSIANATQKAPNGFDFSQLSADIQSMNA